MPILLQLALAFARAGLLTFGSGYAMLALLEREVVHARSWLTIGQFADVVAVSEITPGPITVNLATFVGYRLAGLPGAIAATGGLIAAPMAVLLIIAHNYAAVREAPWVDSTFQALRPVVTALILFAVYRMGAASISDWRTAALFIAAFVALLLRIHPAYVALGGTAAGILLMRLW